MKGAGLLLICRNRIILLQLLRPYKNTSNPIIEHIQIPRGLNSPLNDESNLETAIREFIEETNLYPINKIFLLDEKFQLFWYDNDKIWEYDIYFAYCRKLEKNHSKYLPEIKILYGTINITFNVKCRKYEYFSVLFWPFEKYVKYMLKYQIPAYPKSNYIEFLKKINEVLLNKNKLICKKIIVN